VVSDIGAVPDKNDDGDRGLPSRRRDWHVRLVI
jgi:hypothetical protein